MPVNAYTQSLADVVDVIINISPAAAPRATFNQGLILGESMRISQATRLVLISQGSWAADMASAGFQSTDAEYLAVETYFAQSPSPLYCWVGMLDTSAIQTVAVDSDAKGTGYAQGDLLTVPVGTGGVLTVSTVDGSGAVTGVTIKTRGTGYSVADEQATTTNSAHGAGCKVNVTAVGETPVQAITACRLINFDWYAFTYLGAAKQDHEDLALWVQSAAPSSYYFGYTSDSDVFAGTAGNILLYLQGQSYGRSEMWCDLGVNPYIAVAAMGMSMGLNTGLANSSFTQAFKTLVGISTANLTPTQINNIDEANGNCYISYGNFYNWARWGKSSSGLFFDTILQTDMLANQLQLNIADLLNSSPKIPLTDPGVTSEIHVCNQACENLRTIGFIAPSGIYDGTASILNLNPGDPIPRGYLAQAPKVSSMSKADRSARKSPPIYIVIIEAGAVHSVVVQVNVQQ